MCVCTSRPHYGSEVSFILLYWTGSGFWRDWGTAQHLVSTGQQRAVTAPATYLTIIVTKQCTNSVFRKHDSEVRFQNLNTNVSLYFLAGWFSITDCYRSGFSQQYYLDTKLRCSCLLWEVKGNLTFIKRLRNSSFVYFLRVRDV